MAKNFSSFRKTLLKSKTEEEVKHAYGTDCEKLAAHFNQLREQYVTSAGR